MHPRQNDRGIYPFYASSIRTEKTVCSKSAAIHAKPRKQPLPRLPDLKYDLAGLVWGARKHALRLARLRKRQD